MPEPDLPPLNLSEDFIKTEYEKCPLLPAAYRKKFSGVVPKETLEVLLDYPSLVSRLAEISEKSSSSSVVEFVANLFSSVLLAEENASLLNDYLPETTKLIELAEMKQKNELSSTSVKEVFLKLFEEKHLEKSARDLAKELNLLQENDSAALEKIVDAVLENPATKSAQEEFKAGKEKVLGFLVGQVMKESRGKANPSAVQEILRKKLA